MVAARARDRPIRTVLVRSRGILGERMFLG
jgi:hypothetical protein